MINFKSKKNDFSRVVLIEYPIDGFFTIAFEISPSKDLPINESQDEMLVNLYIPNDTTCKNGKFIMAHKSKVLDTKLSIEEGFNLYKNLNKNVDKIKPSTYQIKTSRVESGLTKEECADLVYSTYNEWDDWERGYCPMPFNLFELFLYKTGQKIESRKLENKIIKNIETK